MSKLTGYRTLIVNGLLLIAGLVGLHVTPEVIEQHLNLALSAITGLNIFMRVLTKGPVGTMLPETVRLSDELSRLLEHFHIEITTAPVGGPVPAPDAAPIAVPAAASGAPLPSPSLETLLPIYAAKAAEAVNEVLTLTTTKAN